MQSQEAFVSRRVDTPTDEAMNTSASPEDEYSPVPAASLSSIDNSSPGSASDHMGVLPQYNPNTVGTVLSAANESASWKTSTSLNVPRVVSNLIPDTLSSADTSLNPTSQEAADDLDDVHKARDMTTGKAGNSKPAATRRRQNAKTRTGGNPTTQRRQKRLERNRESARLSRRRRKQYLEVLEERVTQYSHEMDQGRRAHVSQAVPTIEEKRRELLESKFDDVMNKLRLLQAGLSRTSQEMMVASTFRFQQLKSFALPPSTKFIMWLTLQSDTYFRGGRAASERLSAARIGERMLNSGTDKVTPSQSMWPLVCSEVGLSYEQEEKVRNYQRQTLQCQGSWPDRHTAYASGKLMESAHDAVQAITLRLGQRERSTLSLLSEEQRLKFLSWASRNKGRFAAMKEKLAPALAVREKYQTSHSQHVAANLYVLNHRFQTVLQKVPRAAPLVSGIALRKFSRRPSFESLGGLEKKEKEEGLCRESSFASSGSLKRSASEMSLEGEERPNIPPISPQEAQAAAVPIVESVLGHLKEIIPPPPPTPTVASPVKVPIPAPTPVSFISRPNPFESLSGESSVNRYAAFPDTKHARSSSFLPADLNIVPEEMWPAGEADDFLMNLVDEDWAIGEGIDMELQ